MLTRNEIAVLVFLLLWLIGLLVGLSYASQYERPFLPSAVVHVTPITPPERIGR